MNKFLRSVGITFRREPETGRPRANKLDSVLDREQKEKGEYYYTKNQFYNCKFFQSAKLEYLNLKLIINKIKNKISSKTCYVKYYSAEALTKTNTNE